MGKAEKGTPKDIANRIKAKGLQKLRWYCQMCQKQCRDENGFKCHTMSESHQRQLLLFADNPDKYIDSFSQEFLDGYINLLKRRFGSKRVHANNVYQEYIHDRDHVHMNATQWETLTDFVKWLGKEGHCTVDETEKGWYVAYIDRDPETIRRQEQLAKREKFEKDEEERMQEFINKQIEMGKAKGESEDPQYTELKRDNNEDTIALNMKFGAMKKDKPPIQKSMSLLSAPSSSKSKEKHKKEESKKRSALDEIIEEEKRQKRMKEAEEAKNNPPPKETKPAEKPWLMKDIVVKVVTKDLGSKYYKEKGVVKDVLDKYVAIVKLLQCGTKLKLDQAHLETVVPSEGRKVLLLLGKHKGESATLKKINADEFCASLILTSGPEKGEKIDVEYEYFSKMYTQ